MLGLIDTKGQRKFSYATVVALFPYRFFFILISLNIKVLLILHTKFQPNKPSRSGVKADILVLLVF